MTEHNTITPENSASTAEDKAIPQHYDIAIVGAGMVGAAIACGLCDTKLRILIIDQLAPPAFDSKETPHIRVSALSAASEQFLEELGAWQHIRTKRLCPYRRMAVWEKDVKSLPFLSNSRNEVLFDSHDIHASHLGHIVENDITQLALHQAMAEKTNIHLRTGISIDKIDNSDEGAIIHLSNQEAIHASLVVGADGAQSKVRHCANIGLRSEQYNQHALVITVSYQGKQEDITWQAFTPTGPLAFLPLPDINGIHYASLVWYAPPEKLQSLKNLDDSALLQAITQEFPETLPPLLSVVEKGSFPLIKRHAINYYKQSVVLAGDAAHTINPLAGQGVNLGFQDAQALIQCLRQAVAKGIPVAHPSILSSYEKQRRLQNQAMMNIMDLFYHLFSNNRFPLKLLRNIGLGAANHLPFGKKKVMRYAMGLDTLTL